MKKSILGIAIIAILFASGSLFAQQKEYDPYEAASAQAEQLTETLELEYWQTFYVDSLLRVELPAHWERFQKLQKQKVSSPEIYQRIADEMMERIDNYYQTIFTEDQWKKYLKMGAAKEQKARAKRLNK